MNKFVVIVILLTLFTAKALYDKAAVKWDNPQEEVGICHKCGQEWAYKLIKESALQGHLNHGDFLYKGRPDVEEWEMTDWCNINAQKNE